MEKHRLMIIGAGRIGSGYNWHDDGYTHAGACQSLKERIELVGFVEPDIKRAVAAKRKWEVPVYENVIVGIATLKPDFVSVCVQPEQQDQIMRHISDYPATVKGVWCEKPYVSRKIGIPVQVNYLRRADGYHQSIAFDKPGGILVVYGKDDIHTKCHFDDLAKWWGAQLDYRVFDGPCAYIYDYLTDTIWFDSGGVDAASCMTGMLRNLLNHVDAEQPLWSPSHE